MNLVLMPVCYQCEVSERKPCLKREVFLMQMFVFVFLESVDDI